MQLSPPSRHSIPLWSKYSPQHPVLKHPQFMFLLYSQRSLENETWESVFKNKDTNYKFNSVLFIFLNISEANFPMQNKSIGKTKQLLDDTRNKNIF
jgi:hypothetical protein